jgi:hypothetical protein
MFNKVNQKKRINLINSNEFSVHSRVNESKNMTFAGITKANNGIIILASDNELTVNKWVIIMNYFLNK